MTDTDSKERLLAAFLAAHDAHCPCCNYNLRGLDSTECPECGRALELRVGSSDLRIGRWVASLLALGAAEGVFAFFTIMFAATYDSTMPMLREWAPALVGFILLGAAIVTLVALRRRIWRWNGRAQATLAMTCIFVAGLLPTGYLLFLIGLL